MRPVLFSNGGKMSKNENVVENQLELEYSGDSVKLNDKLEVSFYTLNGEEVLGLDHFHFDEEILLTTESLKKIMELVELRESERKIKNKLKDKGLER